MATHGYMSERRPSMSFYSTQSHTLACTQLIYCIALIIQLFLSVCTNHLSVLPYLSVRGYLHTFRPTQTFLLLNFRETRSPRQVIHIDSQLSAPIGCQKLLLFRFPQNLTVFRMPSLIAQALYTVSDLYSTQSMFDSWFTVESEKMMGKRRTCSKSSSSGFQ